MKKTLLIVLLIITVTACSQQPVDKDGPPNIEDILWLLEETNENLENRDKRIVQLEQALEYREEEIESFQSEIDELMKPNNYDVYEKGYSELQQNSLPRAMRINESTYLRIHPYTEAAAVKGSNRPPYRLNGKDVIIHNCVRNEDNEVWVLVEYPDLTSYACNYGYVPLESLVDTEYSIDLVDDTESIADIKIGDPIEKAILVWGDEYTVHRGPHQMAYSFGSGPDVIIDVDTINNSIMSITIRTKGYYTEEGVMVANSASEVIGIYEEKYERNVDGKLYEERSEYIFKLNDDGYVIEFFLDDNNIPYENISDWNYITRISIYNICIGDW